MEFQVIFDENFFFNFKKRWLKTKEIILFLSNIDTLIRNKFIALQKNCVSCPKNGDYFIFYSMNHIMNIWKNDGVNWKRRKNGSLQESNTILKLDGINV